MKNEEKEILSSDKEKLLQLIKDNKFREKYPNTLYDYMEKSYIFCFQPSNQIKYFILFENDIQVEISRTNKKNEFFKTSIRTNLDLMNFLSQNDLDINKIVFDIKIDKKLSYGINMLHSFIKDNCLKLTLIEGVIPEITFIEDCLNIEKDYTPNLYSAYFYQYFPSEFSSKKNDGDKIFKYIQNDKRKEILFNIQILLSFDEIKKFKITGPFACGKSMTLFKISKARHNIIYINLKVVKCLKGNIEFLKMLFSECSRLSLDIKQKEEFKKKIKVIDLSQNRLKILLIIIEIVLGLINSNIILILDQYKIKNIKYYQFFESEIENLIKEKKNLKIVYCSSINDNEIRNDLIPTFTKFKGQKFDLDVNSQNYYFYYFDLYKQKKSNDILFILFNNNMRYIKIIQEKGFSSGKIVVNDKINKKLKEFQQYQRNKDTIINNYNLADILLFLKGIINEKHSLKNLLEIISCCPLKYFILDINSDIDSFIIKPIFPYMIYFISDYLKNEDCTKYFKEEKYNILTYLSNKVKGEYFEYSSKLGLKNAINNLYNQKCEEVFVDQIATMNEITNPFEYFISTLENENINDEEEEINIKDEREGKDDEITVYLKDEIKEEEIRKKINDYYKKELGNFNIFNEKKINQKNDDLNNKLKNFGLPTDYIENVLFKEISDYRKEIFEKKVNNILNEIMIAIDKKKKKKNINEEYINISIKKKKKIKKNDEISQSIISIKKVYNGNENIFIDQLNSNGKIVDYAFLFGEKDNKKLVTFQMKCYSTLTTLDNIFEDKTKIKEKISPMLINSIKLFNCVIKEWHYILVFYYNQKDKIINNIGIKNLFNCINKNIEYLLYNPTNGKFYTLDNSFKIIEKKQFNLITIDSNLDQFSFTNLINIMYLEKFNKNKLSNEDIKIKYHEGLSKFLVDFEKINYNLETLKNEFKVKNLFYYEHFKLENDTITPKNNFMILYKKKNSNYFVAVKNSKNIISYHDLEIHKDIKRINDLIDYDYEYSYILYFEEKTPKRNFNEVKFGKDEYYYIRTQAVPKEES